MLTTIQASTIDLKDVVVFIILLIVMGFIGMKIVLGEFRAAYTAISIGLVGMILMTQPQFLATIIAYFLGEENPKASKEKHDNGFSIHISPETWKIIGLVFAAVIVLTLLIVGTVYSTKKAVAWYNSPEKVEARLIRNSQALQRIRQGLADSPDYQALLSFKKQLASRQTPEAKKLKEEVERLLEVVRSGEEAAALAPIAKDLEAIRFRNDPAKQDKPPVA